MTIGNQSLKLCHMPSTHSVVMDALLLIPIKNRNILQNRINEQWYSNRTVLNEVLCRVLLPVTFKPNPRAGSGYYNVLSANGNWSC